MAPNKAMSKRRNDSPIRLPRLQKKLLEPRGQPGVISVQQEPLKRLKANSIAVRDFKYSLAFGNGRKQVKRLEECFKQQIRCRVRVGHVFQNPAGGKCWPTANSTARSMYEAGETKLLPWPTAKRDGLSAASLAAHIPQGSEGRSGEAHPAGRLAFARRLLRILLAEFLT
jgi:hypothetical protein